MISGLFRWGNVLLRGAQQITCNKFKLAGGRTRLPKFSAKFPIGLHVILYTDKKKFKIASFHVYKIILSENPLRFNVEPLLK